MSKKTGKNAHWIKDLDKQGIGVWDWDLVTEKVFYSKAWKAMLGYAEDELGSDFQEFASRLHPDNDVNFIMANFQAHLEGKTPVYSQEIRMQTKQGDYRWILAQGSIIERDKANKPLRVTGTHTDITAQKEAVNKLEEQKNFNEKIVTSAPIYVYIFDLVEQKNIYSNDAIFNLIGFTADEIKALDNKLIDINLFHPDDLPKLQQHFKALIKQADGQVKNIEYRVKHKEGYYLHFRSYDTPFYVMQKMK
ncbi:MAG TPA: PAS domain S-box protein [Thiomicrospira sp.]|jgi:PAS domain S-box-containing protein|nr:PAS domain S-box protein [Thiomicrospira sp.]